MSEASRVGLATRIFTLATLCSIGVLLGGPSLRGLIFVVPIAVLAQVVSLARQQLSYTVAVLEGSAAAAVAALTYPSYDAVLPYLAIPALVGGLSAGSRGVRRVLMAEGAALVAGIWISSLLGHGALHRQLIASAITWGVTGLGLGFFGASFRRAAQSPDIDADYRDALALIKALHDLSGKLTSGLDAVSIADKMLQRAAEVPAVNHAMLYVHGDFGPTPLRYSNLGAQTQFADTESLGSDVWRDRTVVRRGRHLAVPVVSGPDVVAVLVVELNDEGATFSDSAAARLTQQLAEDGLRLNAALLFGDVRDRATAQERHRLAREIHDGVAQDVASLGYAVDSLVALACDPEQVAAYERLRGQVSRVVGELRHSVFELRNDVDPDHGLGHGISSFARLVGAQSELTVHLMLDEAPTRLRPNVESEILRIAQEAMTNARKHSGAGHLWVSCRVNPPYARLEVKDDGVGLGAGSTDSQGLHIMRERAVSIGADLEVSAARPDGLGTRVCVEVGQPAG